jgi:hypothetical protein
MPKKEKTLKELQAECEALSKQNFDLRKQNLILTIQDEYLKKLDALVSEREERENKRSHKQ